MTGLGKEGVEPSPLAGQLFKSRVSTVSPLARGDYPAGLRGWRLGSGGVGVRAVVFDFDGLILETEVAILETWQEIYAEHGLTLPMEVWVETLGTAEHWFDPLAHLAGQGVRLDPEETLARRRRRHEEIIGGLSPLPGVIEYLEAAPALGIALGVASSSTRAWVGGHLERLGI